MCALVTGVQTCALPISDRRLPARESDGPAAGGGRVLLPALRHHGPPDARWAGGIAGPRHISADRRDAAVSDDRPTGGPASGARSAQADRSGSPECPDARPSAVHPPAVLDSFSGLRL